MNNKQKANSLRQWAEQKTFCFLFTYKFGTLMRRADNKPSKLDVRTVFWVQKTTPPGAGYPNVQMLGRIDL